MVHTLKTIEQEAEPVSGADADWGVIDGVTLAKAGEYD